jgi:hypothetical protein
MPKLAVAAYQRSICYRWVDRLVPNPIIGIDVPSFSFRPGTVVAVIEPGAMIDASVSRLPGLR